MENVDRKSGIGGSEVAAILGLSPWAGPLSVYASKLGLTNPEPPSLAMRIGTALEEFIIKEYAAAKKVTAARNTRTFRHPTCPWRLATPDAFVGRRNSIEWGLEVKSVSSQIGWDDRPDGVPAHYLVQVHWYIAVMSDVLGFPVPWWDVAVLFHKDQIRYYRLERDDLLEAELFEKVDHFWKEHVMKKKPPQALTAADAAAVRAMYEQRVQEMRHASREEQALAEELRKAWLEKRRAEKKFEAVSARVQQAIGEYAGLMTEVGNITWKKEKDRVNTDWKALVAELEVPDELLAKYTSVIPGPRRLVVPRTWSEEV